MATTLRCARCGREVARPSGPNPRCPACQAPLPSPPATPGGYEELDLGPDHQAPPPAPDRAASRSGMLAASTVAPPRPPGEASRAPAPPVPPPAYKSTDARGGLPIVPIIVGLALLLAIAAFALTRGRPLSSPGATVPPSELVVKTIGRPPEPTAPPAAEPEAPEPVITMDLPEDRLPVARERRRGPEREARPARPVPPPPREVARAEKPPVPRPAAPAPGQATAAPPALEPDPPLPPPQVAAAAPAPETAPTPPASGPVPGVAGEGYRRPRLATPGCVARSLQIRSDVEDFAGESARVRFAVDESGKVSQFSYLSGPSGPRVANAIWSSIQRCDWIPGATADGRPVALFVTMPVNFGQ